MANRSRDKGTAGESAIVSYLQAQGFSACERRALHGAADKGDIAGLHDTVIEAKKANRIELSEWIKELDAEMHNANARFGAVWAWRRGKSSPADWYVVMPGHVFADLLREALR